jgi:nucleoside-diphosphate-sugar epimerase
MRSDLVVITGANGFIGRHFCAQAARHFSGLDSICYAGDENDEYETAGREILAERRVRFFEADFTRGHGLLSVNRQPRFVFHLAASSATWKRDHRCNEVGTQNLVKSLKGLGPGSHLLFTSSIAVMDKRLDYRVPLMEETKTGKSPYTNYGLSKLKAEQWLRTQARRKGFSLSILRLVTVYGTGARRNSLFPVLRKQALRGSALGRLDWPGRTGLLHVDDVCTILLSLATKPPPPGDTEVYLAQEEARTVANISEVVHSKCGLPYEPIRLPRSLWKGLFYQLGLAMRFKCLIPAHAYGSLWRLRLMVENVFWADCQKLRDVLPHWKPALLEENIEEAIGGKLN